MVLNSDSPVSRITSLLLAKWRLRHVLAACGFHEASIHDEERFSLIYLTN